MTESWDQFGPTYDHPPFAGKPRIYMIAASPRTGSNMLGHLLMSTGLLGSPFEYFHKVHAPKWRELLGVNDFPSLINALYARRTSPSGWFGVKAHWFQFAPIAASEPMMRFLDIERYIEIRRRDRVAQAISLVIARQTQAWISFQTAQVEPSYDFAAIRNAVAGLDNEVAQWNRFFTQRKIPRVILYYEDLVEHPRAFTHKLLESFGYADVNLLDGLPFPRRQASEINREWRERYLHDLAVVEAPRAAAQAQFGMGE